MKIAIRADASLEIGTGHIMRCLTLADKISMGRHNIIFICRHHNGNINELIESRGHKVVRLPVSTDSSTIRKNDYQSWLGANPKEDAIATINVIKKELGHCDWMIIDHYGINYIWEQYLRPFATKIMVIDDFAHNSHDCDLLLNQNIQQNRNLYNGLVTNNCQFLIGPKYALLRPEFKNVRQKSGEHSGKIKNVFVFFGGSDPDNATGLVLDAMNMYLKENKLNIDVVVGKSNPNIRSITEQCLKNNMINLHIQVNHIEEFMVRADFAFGASGSTTWERCCLSLPSAIITMADNQKEIARNIDNIGAALLLGDLKDVTVLQILSCIENFTHNPLRVKKMAAIAHDIVDGLGTNRVIHEMGIQ